MGERDEQDHHILLTHRVMVEHAVHAGYHVPIRHFRSLGGSRRATCVEQSKRRLNSTIKVLKSTLKRVFLQYL